MQAVQLLHNFIAKSCSKIHSRRIQALFIAVGGLVIGSKLTLTGIGRALRTGCKTKNNIKCIDRLLGNNHLHSERREYYNAATKLIMGNAKRPKIIVDWSPMPHMQYVLLRASVPTKGRALTIYEEVHPLKKLGNRKVQTNFLKTLSTILAKNCLPIFIMDAGFHSPFFKEIEKLGWDWIARIRNGNKYKESTDWFLCKDLYKKATTVPRFICKALLSKTNPIECFLFLFKGKKKGRIAKNKSGKRKQDEASIRSAKANKEPWLLATSLKNGEKIARKVIKLYKFRMQIEESFRDVKNSRLGFSFEESQTYKRKRFEILLLISMLAILAVTILGKAGELRGIQYDFQANTIRNRTVLSLFFLGCQLVRHGDIKFNNKELWMALNALKSIITKMEGEYEKS